MAVISASGMSVGVDGSSIIQQLVAIQSRPLYDIRKQQSEIQAQISAYGRVKSAVSTFQSAMSELASPFGNAFVNFSATSSNEGAFTASAGSSAVAGTYSVNVVNLASAKKQASSAYVDSVTDIGGSGTIEITVNGSTSSIAVAAGSTLADIRDAINQAGDNPGVTASILNEAGGSRLILSSDETGIANEFTLNIIDDDANPADNAGLSKLFYEDPDPLVVSDSRVITAAVDAEVEIDGFTITSATNKVTGAIEGVSLDLVAAGTSGTLTIARDDGAIQEAVNKFVTAYNDLRGTITSMYEGELERDPSLRLIEQSLTSVINATMAAGPYSHISQIGVTRDKFGVMSLDASALTDALDTDLDAVAALFADATNGVAVRLEAFADQLIGFDGVLATREEGLNSRMKSLEEQENRWELRVLDMEARYKRQFAAMDAAVSSMQASSNYLASNLAALMG
jgi:flagellar hook-associated protein 2